MKLKEINIDETIQKAKNALDNSDANDDFKAIFHMLILIVELLVFKYNANTRVVRNWPYNRK